MTMFIASGNAMESQRATSSSVQWSKLCHEFEFSEILLATQNFDESLVIGHGGFGKVYRGNIKDGSSLVVAAVKRLDPMSNQGATEFWAEVEMLSKLRHCNIVSLFGYCKYEKEMILVYEYMPNGTLEDHLHKLRTPLPWLKRLKICISAARGLDYLHTGTGIEFGVMHRDVKSSNILLHDSWAAKISDFGLSRIGPTNQPSTYVNTLVKGTFGYLDPNYFTTGRLTRKSDVYAFGVVLFEVLCRKRAVDRTLDEDQWGLVTWVQDAIKEGNLRCIIDSDISNQISSKCLKEFVQIADGCLHSHPKHRPTMAEVVVSLNFVLTLQEKTDSSLQPAGRTMLRRMVKKIPFASKGESSASSDPKISSNHNDVTRSASNIFPDNGERPADLRILSPSLKVFKFADLKRATENFSQYALLGWGAFGEVFLGWINQKTFAPSKRGVGIAVAVKRHSAFSMQGGAEWLNEVNILGRLAHSNIINLVGYCNDEQEYFLVYEYMQKKSLDRFIYRDAHVVTKPLSWRNRLLILIGVARGLTYLHLSKDQIIVRSLKCSDILLDQVKLMAIIFSGEYILGWHDLVHGFNSSLFQDFNAKIGDFGLARFGPESGKTHVSTCVKGSGGNSLAPEYIRTGHLSVKSDIYSFGVLLLETLTGLKEMDIRMRYDTQDLTSWSSLILERRKLKETIDSYMDHNYPEEGASNCVRLAIRCLAYKPKDRPSSEEVLLSLEQIREPDSE